MLPTFFGLNTVTRALLAQQEAVDVVNQNISNSNTPGYSLQDPVLQATDPYTATAFNRPSLAGQLGTGSAVTKINRAQDELLNSQIRFQNQGVGQLQVLDDQYTQIQAIYNDPSNVALNSAATSFFNSIHDMVNNPESQPARQVVEQQGAALSSAVTARYSQLTTLQGDLNARVQAVVVDVNSTVNQIARLNNQIAQATGVGDNANDLMDQRDQLVDHLSTLVDVRDVKNNNGTDTIQLNGRFLVDKDQAYTLTTLTDANSTAAVKPVKVFWQEDVSKFENLHPGYDPISGRSLASNAPLVSGQDAPPLSVAVANVTTGSLAGTMNIRDNVIQDTLLPQLNELADSMTNTQALSLTTGLTGQTQLSGAAATPDDFTVTVVTPPSASTPPGAGQSVTYSIASAKPTTVQNVVDAINSSAISPYVHASLNASGQLQIDTIVAGSLVKVDKANAAASKDFGFSPVLADGFNLVHVQGYGLNTPGEWTGGIAGLTAASSVNVTDTLQITGPDGQTVNVVVPPPVTNVYPAPTTTTVQALIDTINAKGLSHGFQAALDTLGHLTIFSAPSVYGASGQALGVPAQITGDNTGSVTTGTTLTAGSAVTITGPAGTMTYTAAAGDTVQTLINSVNSSNVGVTASINSVGQFQLTTVNSGSSQKITLSSVSGDLNTVLGLNDGSVSGLDHGFPPSATISVANGQVLAATNTASEYTVSQPATPQQLLVQLNGTIPPAVLGPGANITITGIDSTTNQAVTETLSATTLSGAPINFLTSHTFSSITDVSTNGISGGNISVMGSTNTFPTASITQPVAAGQQVTLQVASGGAGFVVAPGATVKVTGVVGGATVTQTLSVPTAGPFPLSITTPGTFTSITSIVATGIINGNLSETTPAGGTAALTATPIVAAQNTATSPYTITQPTVPAQLTFQLTSQSGQTAAYASGANVQVSGVDAVSGSAVTETVAVSANGTFTTTHFFKSITGVVTNGISKAQLAQLGPSNSQKDFFGGGTGLGQPVNFTNTNQFFFQGSAQALQGQVVAPLQLGSGSTVQSLTPTAQPAAPPSAVTIQISGTGDAFASGANVQVTGIDPTTGQTITDTLNFSATGSATTTHTFQKVTSITVNGIVSTSAIGGQIKATDAAAATLLQTNLNTASTTAPVIQITSPTKLAFTLSNAPNVSAIFTSGSTIQVTGVDSTTGASVTESLAVSATGALTTTHTFSSIASITTSGVANADLQAYAVTQGAQYDTAASMAVDSRVANDPTLIAASNMPAVPGNTQNGLALLNVQQQSIVSNGQAATTFGDFYSTITENLGAAAQQTHTNLIAGQQVTQHLTNQKQSIVGVNLDEEAARLITLQHAYQAAARAITTEDSMLDTIVNSMGLVGR